MKAGANALLGSNSSSSSSSSSLDRCVSVSSYLEAVGILACHKAGVNPACLTPDVAAIHQMAALPAASESVANDAASGVVGVVEGSSRDAAAHSQELRSLVDA